MSFYKLFLLVVGTIAETLLVLDLSENHFEVLPRCVLDLRKLNALIVKGNQFLTFDYDVSVSKFTGTLQVSSKLD